MPNIDLMSPASGRMLNENNIPINIADILDRLEPAYGLSTDTKPTTGINNGKKYLEVNTGAVYVFYNGTWYPL